VLRRLARRGRSASRSRLTVLLTLVSAALIVVVGVQAATPAGDDGATSVKKFQRVNPKSISKVKGWKPAFIASNRQSTVILELSGDPVAKRTAEARKQGKDLTKEEKQAIRAELKGRQDAIKGRIQSTGGRVLNQYQDAYNGIGVRIALKDVAALSSLPGVQAVRIGRVYRFDNTAGVKYIGGPQAWQNPGGKTGTGVKIAILDTGVDYTHANFGGPGTVAAFTGNNGTIIEPGTFPTAKVIGGFDFVGDNFDSDSDDPAKLVPHPDPDPLDCNGHGSHVAGTAAGFGVTAAGAKFNGPYNANTLNNPSAFRIGPGVAPDAKILAYRVFGCEGSTDTDTLVAAINRASEEGADVINMSLGSPFGRSDEPDGIAADNVAASGVVVVAAAGNAGPNAYIHDAPGVANRVISAAAIDASSPTFPGANIALQSGTIQAINVNGSTQLPLNAPIKVLRNPDGTVSLGCDPAEYNGTAGMIVVTVRGTCARVARAVFGQKAGSAAVIMINTTADFPPFEGKITENPDTGEKVDVTIPFLGVKGVLGPAATDDGDALVAADGATVSVTATTVTNTGYERITSFSSGGPRNVDSAQKPDIAAPGQSVVSTGVGTGNEAATISGTSMATPMVAGSAALVTQAHPDWSTERIKAALMNTAKDPVPSLNPRTGGSGVVQVNKAVLSKVVMTSGTADSVTGVVSLSYGYEPLSGAYTETKPLTLTNTSNSAERYNLASSGTGSGFTISFSSASVNVPAHGTATVNVTLAAPASAIAALPSVSTSVIGWGGLLSLRGLVTATPTSGGTGIYPLRVPWLVAPRGLSNVTAGPKTPYVKAKGGHTSSVTLTNSGIHSGTADVYSWGINDPNDTSGGEDNFDVRDVGVQELPTEALTGTPDANDKALVFAINTYGRWSNASVTEFDIAIDTKGNSNPEFFVVGIDFGAFTTGTFDGRIASFILDAAGNLIDVWVPEAPMNGSTILLPTLASEIGIDKGKGKFNYQVATFPIVPELPGDITGVGGYKVGDPPVSNGDFLTLNPGESKTLNLFLDRPKIAGTTVRGWLAVSIDDPNGSAQADEIPVEPLP
jgi:minor extracellular serine protease Vpr